MVKGTISFFKLDDFGFYKKGKDLPEKGDFKEMVFKFHEWVENCTSYEDTCPFDGKKRTSNKSLFCLNTTVDNQTGDMVAVLWKTIGAQGGSVSGIDITASPNQSHIKTVEKAAKDIVFGEPMYYWFIPSLNTFASIRFANSVSDINLVKRYFRSFVNHFMECEGRHVTMEEKDGFSYKKVTFRDKNGDGLHFKFNASTFKHKMNEDRLDALRKRITHLVKRDYISATGSQGRDLWSKMTNGLPLISAPKTKDHRRVESVSEIQPSLEELRELLQIYENSNFGGWENIGVRVDDSERIIWLDEFSAREYIAMDYKRDNLPILTAEQLMIKLQSRRSDLIATIAKAAEKAA
ncbi:hypothetical protein [Pseudoalteromonas sp. MMG024]|uniref:hypothetical protein n=1 Tax=Pseudoalteromonas sp. MMG024 TaxID=2909980 RepID=UPI001F366FFB|nr:hypothetical protein [Pseudoalteromonas sp. MMG024]MCF6458358.1 hypothetical protein [Pseudoalteromonas sp. MMG024]